MDWESLLSTRARAGADPELAIILAGPPPGTLGMTGGFPNAATFPSEELAEIAARLVRDEPGLALQYTAERGHPRASASTWSSASRTCRAASRRGRS